jgi:hypothetical protein
VASRFGHRATERTNEARVAPRIDHRATERTNEAGASLDRSPDD